MSVRRIMFALAVAVSGAGAASADEADQGIVCATALKAPVDQMPSVIAACSKIQRKQPLRPIRPGSGAISASRSFAPAICGGRRNFDKTLRLTPDDHWALQRRAEANEQLGHPQLAIPDYQRLAVLQPGTRWRMKVAELGGRFRAARAANCRTIRSRRPAIRPCRAPRGAGPRGGPSSFRATGAAAPVPPVPARPTDSTCAGARPRIISELVTSCRRYSARSAIRLR